MEATTLAILAILVAALLWHSRRRRYRFPPGPKGLPIIGNILDMPTRNSWLTYETWGREYGSDIIYLHVLGIHIIVLNSLKAINEVLEKRSSIYSSRIVTTMAHDLLGWDKLFALMPYGEYWREHRKMFHQHFQPDAMTKHHVHISRQAKDLLRRLLAKPDDLIQNLRFMAGSTILRVSYGIDALPENDHYLGIIEEAVHSLVEVENTGAYMVDFLPILKYLPSWAPGAQFKRDAAKWSKQVDKMFDEPFDVVKRALAEGSSTDCVCASLLSELDESKDRKHQETVIKQTVGTAYAGAADTTVSSLASFVLAMMQYPDVQRTAQQEIDRITGGDRLPSIEDRDSLPYIVAIVKETLRWRPVIRLGVPHISTAGDEYRGYHFPEGSVVMGNAWAVLHDETRYPHPEAFDPTRFLTPDGELDKDAPDSMEAGFGFGRRICAGLHFAMDSMWINMAYILATLDIEKPVDDKGSVVEPSGEYTTGLLAQPLPFKVSFKPRSKAAEVLVQEPVLDG